MSTENFAEKQHAEWFSSCYIDSSLPEPVLFKKIEERLTEIPLASHLAYANEQDDNHTFDDFLWLYHGALFRHDIPPVERDGIIYDKVDTSAALPSGILLHVRHTTNPDVDQTDLRRHFVATLDLTKNETVEWQVAAVDKTTRWSPSAWQGRVATELYLTHGPFGLPVAEETEPHGLLETVRARKMGQLMLQRSFSQLPRVVLDHQSVTLVHDGLIERTTADLRAVVEGKTRLGEIQAAFGHMFEQEIEPAATIAVA